MPLISYNSHTVRINTLPFKARNETTKSDTPVPLQRKERQSKLN